MKNPLGRTKPPQYSVACVAMDDSEQSKPSRPSARQSFGPYDDLLDSAAFETLVIHAGQHPDPATGAVVAPIYAVSTYAQDSVANPRAGYIYSRQANPTRTVLENCIASLEDGLIGAAFASGIAAEDAVFRTTCRPGDHVVIPDDIYGGTFRLLDKVLTRWGVTPVPIWDTDAVAASITDSTRLIWCETPTNPLLGVADIRALANIAHGSDSLLVVDNTFASPYLQQPLRFGADIVVHSTTKYLGGHSDVVGGALVTKDEELGQSIKFHQNSMGAISSPFDSWLTLRGIKTLAVRMERQCVTAARITTFLQDHPSVERVFYPGLPGHRGHGIARKQMSGFGGIVSFTVHGGESVALKVCNAARLFTLAESIGAVESLISHPLLMTHASTVGSKVAPPADLIRISVGLESPDDLIADLSRAFQEVGT